MYDYYIKCKQSQKQELLDLCVKLELISIEKDGSILALDGIWDEIGIVKEEYADGKEPIEGETKEDPREPKGGMVDPDYYVNLRTKHDLSKYLESKEKDQVMSFFQVNDKGETIVPTDPVRVWL